MLFVICISHVFVFHVNFIRNMNSVIELRLSSDVDKQTAHFVFWVNKYLNISKHFGSVLNDSYKRLFCRYFDRSHHHFIPDLCTRVSFLCRVSLVITLHFFSFPTNERLWFMFYAKKNLRTERLNNR